MATAAELQERLDEAQQASDQLNRATKISGGNYRLVDGSTVSGEEYARLASTAKVRNGCYPWFGSGDDASF